VKVGVSIEIDVFVRCSLLELAKSLGINSIWIASLPSGIVTLFSLKECSDEAVD